MVANKNEGSQFSEKNVSNVHLIKVCLAHVKEQSPGRVLACVFPLRSERLICYKLFVIIILHRVKGLLWLGTSHKAFYLPFTPFIIGEVKESYL